MSAGNNNDNALGYLRPDEGEKPRHQHLGPLGSVLKRVLCSTCCCAPLLTRKGRMFSPGRHLRGELRVCGRVFETLKGWSWAHAAQEMAVVFSRLRIEMNDLLSAKMRAVLGMVSDDTTLTTA